MPVKVSKLPSIERLNELLICDPIQGKLYWKPRGKPRWDNRFAGREAGSQRKDGYVYVKVEDVRTMRHRFIWAIYHQTVRVPDEIDHINRVRNDDRIENLRAATDITNARNRNLPSNNTSGISGVDWYPRYDKWSARIGAGDSRRFLGYFETKDEAIAARLAAERELNYGRAQG